MGRASNDIITLAVLGIGAVVIYTKTDWFQQLGSAVQDILGDLKGAGGGGKPLFDLGGGGGGDGSGGAIDGGDGGGNLNAGEAGLIFKGTGKSMKAKDSGKTTRNYASGGSSGTTQWDIKGVPWNNIESTLFVDVGGCGDETSIKHYGPDHSDGKCCWLIMNVNNNSGQFQLGGEGPHPTTEKTNLGTGQSIGSMKNKRVGIKFVSWIDSQVHARGYAFEGGKWVLKLSKDFSQFGAKKKASKPASGANVQFRTDCNNVKYSIAESAEILPGTAGSGAGAGAAVSTGASIPNGDSQDENGNNKNNDNDKNTKSNKSNYTDALFAVHKPLPLGFYNARMGDVIPIRKRYRSHWVDGRIYCDQLPPGSGIRCEDRNG